MNVTFNRLLLALVLLCSVVSQATAQNEKSDKPKVDFMEPAKQFSKKKPAFVTLTSGEVLKGVMKKYAFTKGFFSYMMFEDESGELRRIPAAKIKSAYLMPSKLSKFTNALEDSRKVYRWNKDLGEDKFKDGYVYLETVTFVIGRKKKRTVKTLLQLLNPHFSDGYKVFQDLYARQNQSADLLSFGGDKPQSYVLLKNGESRAKIIGVRNYKQTFESLFGDCPAVKPGKKPKWSKIVETVYLYGQECPTVTK